MEIVAQNGFVFVATGERYHREAAAAAAQLRRTNPGARVCLIADVRPAAVFWDDFVLHPGPVFGFRDKLVLNLCPYERYIFLDTDAHVVGDLAEVFVLLERFDFAAHQLFEGHDSPVPGVPDAFPEFNTGVMAFRRSAATDRLFVTWQGYYDRFRAPGLPDRDAYVNVTDQKSLRLAVFESGLRIAVLGPEYNFTPANVHLACASVRILHGRGGNFDAFERRINARLGTRSYHPALDAVLTAQPSTCELRGLWRRATLQLLRRVVVACTPVGLRNRLRGSESVRNTFLRGPFSPK